MARTKLTNAIVHLRNLCVTNIISKSYKVCGNLKTVEFLDKLKDLGFEFAFKSGLSIALHDIHIPNKKDVYSFKRKREIFNL